MNAIIETERLTLDELAMGRDEPFLLELLNDAGFLAQIGDRGVRDLEDARRYMADGPIASYAAHGYGLWRVSLRRTGEPIGISGLIRREGFDDSDIGYAFLERFRGQGFAQEAGRAVMEHALRVLALPRVVGVTSLDNHASIAVLQKLGLRFEMIIDLPELGAPKRFFTT